MDLIEIGYFSKTHGIKGHLILKAEKDFDFEDVNACFIDVAGGRAPYFISELKENERGFIVLLEEVDKIEKAKLLVSKKVFIDSKFVPEQEEVDDWVGFELIDKSFGSLGKIIEVNDNGHQILVSISYKDKEVILPLVEDFIENIDELEKKIKFNAPEGLIELYLDNN
jgi:16S rRNA processing protein RimM